MYILPADVIRISPTSAADSGNNATLSQFGDEYPGLLISTSQMNVPKNVLGAANPATSYTNGQTCPSGKGAKYAGQTGKVTYAYWTHLRSEEADDHHEPRDDQVRAGHAYLDGLRALGRHAAARRCRRPINAMVADATTPDDDDDDRHAAGHDDDRDGRDDHHDRMPTTTTTSKG